MKKLNPTFLVIPAALMASVSLAQAPAQQPVTADFVLQNNDTNKDGIITKEEATKAARQLAQVWDTFDANKDGKVDREEITKGLAATQGGGAGGPAAPPAGAPPAGAPPAAAPPAAN